MRYGLDAAYPDTTREHLDNLRKLGFEWMAGYIGGHAWRVWTPDDWDRVYAAGFDVLPIWVAPLSEDPGREVGIEDGNRCILAMQAARLTGVVVLDIENGVRPEEYAAGFVDACHNGLVDVVGYGTAGSIGMHVDWDAWWLAFWPQSPMPLRDAPPEWHYWQYASGQQYDFSVARDAARFAGRIPIEG